MLYEVITTYLTDYKKNIIFFLSTFFTEEIKDNTGKVTGIKETLDRDSFLNTACEIYPNISPENIPKISDVIKSSNFETLYSKLKKTKDLFKVSFTSHFLLKLDTVENRDNSKSFKNTKLPYLDINSKSFDTIYGNKNPYISIYLKYIFEEESKPLLSYIINKRVNENNSVV